MMSARLSHIGRSLLRSGLLLFLLAGLVLPALPAALQVWEEYQGKQRVEGLIARHQRALSMPVTPNRYAAFEAFTAPAEDQSSEALGDALQANVSRLLQAPDMRLLDLRRLNDETDIAGLVGLRLQGELDGDFQAILTRLSALSAEYPSLEVEKLDLTPRGPSDRPDRNMRLQVTLVQWVEFDR